MNISKQVKAHRCVHRHRLLHRIPIQTMNQTEIIYEKNCKTCGALKPLTKFGKCSNARDGREGTCHSCRHIFDYYADLKASRQERREISDRYRSLNRTDYSAGKIRESDKYRRAAKLLPNTLTDGEWNAIKNFYDHSCAYCGIQPEKLVRCRIEPVSKGGGLTAQNVVPSCISCSTSKKHRVIYPVVMHHVGTGETIDASGITHGQTGRQTGGHFTGPSQRFSTEGYAQRSLTR